MKRSPGSSSPRCPKDESQRCPAPPNLPLIFKDLSWYLLDGAWDILKGSWRVLDCGMIKLTHELVLCSGLVFLEFSEFEEFSAGICDACRWGRPLFERKHCATIHYSYMPRTYFYVHAAIIT